MSQVQYLDAKYVSGSLSVTLAYWITLFWLLGNLRLIWFDLTPLLLIWFCARKKTNNDHKCWNALTKAVFFGKFFTTFMFTLNWILQIWYGERGRRLLACEEQLGGGLGWRRLCEQFSCNPCVIRCAICPSCNVWSAVGEMCAIPIAYSNFRNYAHPLHVKEGITTEKVFLVFSESFFLDLFWLSHVHLGVNGCHRKVGISNVKT